jgi:hypothetical protein
MLIDDRVPPFSAPEQRVWEPDWRLWAWVLAALAAGIGCFASAGLLSFVLLCAALGCGAQAGTRALPYGGGLREHRQ